ncbi:pyruvate dehydrogenase complex dihydrolipoamide acetyltransferase [Methylacidimicrobium sp. B4]|uniref:pyruvate dehydrogenase complex dihydrolipoamide acetyltransferase n=1 Tax=Methylacidimicrobium sp. B4 TaxID=2796139 RepID=UPI001A8F131E|nr:pyruvate dehydrogenase complex dihydrolipoamide acetyltransferase [Methylacidimicrobium sp. B4]QSR84735.1 pyruvate dehydrogenase complex dihydrolipoamide acetyltransferase [Methylacidimicrobium sp. B4]
MAKQLTMPQLSPSMAEGRLVAWRKKEGDPIEEGEVIAEVETDKAVMDLEAFESGVLRKILIHEGDRAPVNAPIAIVGSAGEPIESLLPSSPASALSTPPLPTDGPESRPPEKAGPASDATARAEDGSRIKASPLAKKIAAEGALPLSTLSGSGPGGRIVKRDVLQALAASSLAAPATPAPASLGEERLLPLSLMREQIGARLLASKTSIPHYYLEIEINASPLLALRAEMNEALAALPSEEKLSINDFFLKATAEAARRVPEVNASWEGKGIRQFSAVHLAVAVAVPDGLITPVIRSAQDKSLRELARVGKELAARARERKLKPEEYSGGTLTLSNLGMYGIESFAAIINPPQALILAVGALTRKPVVDDQDRIVVGHRVRLVASCDHRIVDGALGARFLREIQGLLERPLSLLL